MRRQGSLLRRGAAQKRRAAFPEQQKMRIARLKPESREVLGAVLPLLAAIFHFDCVGTSCLFAQNMGPVATDLPLSVLATTDQCVFGQCTFRDDTDGFSVSSPLSIKVFSKESSNRIQTLPPHTNLEILDIKEFRGRAGAVDP